MENRDKHISTTAPLLRGLTFDGEKGAIVVFDEAIPAHDEQTLIVSIDPAEESSGERVIESFRAFQAERGCCPRRVVVEGLGAFLLGPTYDEAKSGAGEISQAASTSRADVVRNKISVVTGGAQGFGESIVRALVDAGSLVFVADINLDGANALAASLNEAAGRTVALPVAGNVSDEESVAAMMADIVRQAGGIDLFVSNAGVLKAGSVKEMTLGDFSFVTNVNYLGFFLCVKHVSKVLARQNRPGGRYYSDILQINSKSGLEGSNKNGAYAGGKFGAIGLVQSFAMELIEDNVKVNAICPGNFFSGPLWSDPDRGLFVQYLNTGKVAGAKTIDDVRKFYESKVPMGRGCDGEDVVKAILYAVEQRYETGQAIPVTGGQVMLK